MLLWVPFFVSTGDWRKSADAATERHDHEIHGSETGACTEVMPSYWEAETRQTVRGARAGLSLPDPWAISPEGASMRTLTHGARRGYMLLQTPPQGTDRCYNFMLTSRVEKVCRALLTHYLIPSSLNKKLFKSKWRHLTLWNPKGKESL